MKGNVKAGETLFFSEGYDCGKCHTVHGRAVPGTRSELGPDLTYIARTRAPQFIVDSILNPRAYIAPEYEMLTIVTKDVRRLRVGSVICMPIEEMRIQRQSRYLTTQESCGQLTSKRI